MGGCCVIVTAMRKPILTLRAGKERKKDELREGKNLNIAMSRTAPPIIRPGKTDIREVSMSYLPGREIPSRNLNVGNSPSWKDTVSYSRRGAIRNLAMSFTVFVPTRKVRSGTPFVSYRTGREETKIRLKCGLA
jgi:hypothetical protein